MSEQYPGGFVTKTTPVPANNYQATPAPGMWTLTQQAQLKTIGVWPTVGVLPPTSWVGLLSPPSGYTQANLPAAYTFAIDSSESIYFASYFGPSSGPFVSGTSLLKVTKNGAISWVQNYAFSGEDSTAISTVLDTSGNVYTAQGQAAGASQVISKRLQSTGSLTWVTQSAINDNQSGPVAGPDSSGFVYMLGYGDGTLKGTWSKFNGTTGANTATVGGLNINSRGYAYYPLGYGYADPSGNVYAPGSTIYEGFYVKFNSSGGVSVCSTLGTGGYGGNLFGFKFEAASTPSYFCATGYPYSNTGTFNLYKVQTSDGTTVNWSHYFGSLYPYQGAVAIDTSNNVYLLARDNTNSKKLVLIKFNSSGTVQFSRYIENSDSTSASVVNINWDSAGSSLVILANMNFSGAITTKGFVMRVPADGSQTGDYGNTTYGVAGYSSDGSGYSGWTSASTTLGSWSAGFTTGTGVNSTKTPTLTLATL